LATSLFPCLSAAGVDIFLAGLIAAGNEGTVCVGGNGIDGGSGFLIVPLFNVFLNLSHIAYSSSSWKGPPKHRAFRSEPFTNLARFRPVLVHAPI